MFCFEMLIEKVLLFEVFDIQCKSNVWSSTTIMKKTTQSWVNL